MSIVAALPKQCALKQGADGNVLKQTGKYSIFFVIHNKQIHLRFFDGWLYDFFLSADGTDSADIRGHTELKI